MTKKMTTDEIREAFLRFFESKHHRRVPSSPLVPMLAPGKTDETILFTNAGMNQFKRTFLGEEHRDYSRAASCQKCVRAGGKHNDLENVGRTTRHHTFFEMLGNFSFGDYFKKEAIGYAWEFITSKDWMGIEPRRLWVTIHDSDDEAELFWRETLEASGVFSKAEAADRIRRMGDKDNFWQMGETGPCGPCSEIHYDISENWKRNPGGGPGSGDDDGERYLEIWNLVFMQFDQHEDGSREPLPKPSIDTGMGLERIARVMQGTGSNFEIDIIREVIAAGEKLTGVSYANGEEETRVSLRVIADHARAGTFLIGDGVLPGNEGRGYVLRRILRRAIRHQRKLGTKEPMLHSVADKVIDVMKGHYPELEEKRVFVVEAIKTEEERFLATLDNGLAKLRELLDAQPDRKVLSGKNSFELYDTYGFPLDLTQQIGEEWGFRVDHDGFETEMQKQRERSRAARGSISASAGEAWHKVGGIRSEFLGYEVTRAEAELKAILKVGERVDVAKAGDEVELIFDATPFYGESGGQIGDTGMVEGGDRGRAVIRDTQKPTEDLIAHNALIEEGELRTGERYTLVVDEVRRARIRRNHSATHLLHAALRQVLGKHVQQAGSLVAPDRLRFDFTHPRRISAEELAEIEHLVNREIEKDWTVEVHHQSYDDAVREGAVALFGEKYGDSVRTVRMGEASMELCGGTHVSHTGDIGIFKIVREEGIAGGTRRIVALTGDVALASLRETEKRYEEVLAALGSSPEDAPNRVRALLEANKRLEDQVADLKRKLATGGGAAQKSWLESVEDLNGMKALIHRVDGLDGKAMRELADRGREHLGSGVVVLGGENDGKALLLVAATDDLEKKVHSGKLISQLAPIVGGKGGGKPSFAQAGGTEPGKIDEALGKARQLIGG